VHDADNDDDKWRDEQLDRGELEQYVWRGAVNVWEQLEHVDKWPEDAVFGDGVLLGQEQEVGSKG
jgi:hypothetical protein